MAVLTSGGDAPGMNAAVRCFVMATAAAGGVVYGVRRGYEGLLDDDMVELGLADVDGISRHGGTLLGSARSALFPTEAGQEAATEVLAARGIEGLCVIGGNGSLTGAHRLGDRVDFPIVGVPASIDNDVGFTRLSIGVDTAVNTIVEACDRISDTARAHRRAFVVEVMGRYCGYLAMRAGVAADADAILFAEREQPESQMFEELEALLTRSFSRERGKKRVLIVMSEGLPTGSGELVRRLQAHLDAAAPGVGIRRTILGHVVRGGSPSALDRMLAQRLANQAARALLDGKRDVMCAWEPPIDVGTATEDPSVRLLPLDAVLTETAAMLDVTSIATRRRVALVNQATALLGM